MDKRILITGAAGFIGRQLSDRLKSKGAKVVQVDNLSEKPILEPQKDLILSDVQQLNAKNLADFQIDTIVHLAAKKNVKDSFFNLNNSIENYEMTIKLFDAAVRAGVKKVFLASTCEIFGFQSDKLSENAKYKPHSPYAVSKVANEYLSDIYMMLDENVKFTSLNFFNTYGPTEGLDAVIPNFVSKAIKNETIKIEGDGSQARDFTYIDDTIDVLFDIILSDEYFRSVNIGSGLRISVNDILNIIKNSFPKLNFEHVDARPNEIKYFEADNDLIKNTFSFDPKINIEEGIKKVINFHKAR